MDTSRDKGKGKPAEEGDPAAPPPAGDHPNRLAPRRPWLTGTAPSVREANERAASDAVPDAPVGSAASLEPSRPWLDQERDSPAGSPRPEVRKPPASLAIPEEAAVDEPLNRRERRQQRRADRQAEKFRQQEERESAKAQAQQDRESAKAQAQQQRDDERARREAEKASRRTGAPAPVAESATPPQPPAPQPPAVPPPVVTPPVPRPEQVRVPIPDVVQSAPQPPALAEPEPVEPAAVEPEPVDAPAPAPVHPEPEPEPVAAVAASAPQPPAEPAAPAPAPSAPAAPLPVSEYQAELDALRAQIAELAAELNAAPALAPRGSAEPDEGDGAGGLFRRGRRPDGQ